MAERLLRKIFELSRERLTVVLTDRQATVLALRLEGGKTLPERRHVRSDVVLQVIGGKGELEGFRRVSLTAPDALFIPCGETYALGNGGPEELVLLAVISPGVTTLHSRPYGSVKCPMCSAEVAVEEGDVPGDRFICPDCTAWMRIVEAERGYTAEPLD